MQYASETFIVRVLRVLFSFDRNGFDRPIIPNNFIQHTQRTPYTGPYCTIDGRIPQVSALCVVCVEMVSPKQIVPAANTMHNRVEYAYFWELHRLTPNTIEFCGRNLQWSAINSCAIKAYELDANVHSDTIQCPFIVA